MSAVLLLGGCQGGTPSETSTTTAPPTPGSSAPGSSSPGTPAPGTAGASTAGTLSPSGVYKPADATGKARNVPVPVMPALAKENTKEGLEAFIRYWFQLLSYSYETGDTARVAAVTSEGCTLCAYLASSIQTNYEGGRWVSGGSLQTPVVEASWSLSSSSQQGKVQLIQTEIHYFDAQGSEHRDPTPATNDAVAFFADFQDGAWVATDTGIIR
ncbi:DUF6318 family protein [Paenarthrobacter sp. NPDC090520]|uniref:DUF6318 family protein n=1 Tax=Paenarthrobacter sp. NPDC090520 TaxID=3364382 RepID=UPI00382C200C